jgi:hypothetical protein
MTPASGIRGCAVRVRPGGAAIAAGAFAGATGPNSAIVATTIVAGALRMPRRQFRWRRVPGLLSLSAMRTPSRPNLSGPFTNPEYHL